MKESAFQHQVITELKELFPGCMVLKNDSGYLQGVPDLLLLWNDHWAALEVKRSTKAKHQPNQDWWVSRMNEMSLARFVSPENKEEVFRDIQQAFGV